MSNILSRLVWGGWFRVIAFWLIAALGTVGAGAAAGLLHDMSSLRRPFDVKGGIDPDFAISLAIAIGAVGSGLLIAYALMHAVLVRVAMRGLRRVIARHADRRAFAEAYETEIYPRLQASPLIGHAWKEFDETLLRGSRSIDGVIGNTVRPQAFINYGVIREKLSGLKMLPSISGYFVGIGLLLTFMGIVLALHIAGDATSGADAAAMQVAMTDLLHTASFKFATSIAGLGVSIVFGIFARLIVIWIEGGLNRFCEALEEKLRYAAPQSITAEMNEVGKQQLVQLKELSSQQYFSRFADVIEQAMARAIAPLANGIGAEINRGAGTEIQRLGEVLGSLQSSLANMQGGLERLDSVIASAAGGASGKIETAMQDVLGKLQIQVAEFLDGMRANSTSAANDLIEARRQADEAQQNARQQIAAAGSDAAQSLREGLGDVVSRISDQVSRIQAAMEESARAHETQAVAIRSAASQTETVGEALASAAGEVRSAIAPLAQVGQEIGRASTQVEQAISRSTAELGRLGEASRDLADALAAQVERLSATWDSYRSQFDRVDEDLAKAVQGLADASGTQAAALTGYVTKVDEGMQRVLGQLRPAIDQIGESTTELSDTLSDFLRRFPA